VGPGTGHRTGTRPTFGDGAAEQLATLGGSLPSAPPAPHPAGPGCSLPGKTPHPGDHRPASRRVAESAPRDAGNPGNHGSSTSAPRRTGSTPGPPSLDPGVPPHVVREIVGHSDIEVTMTIYAHVSLDEKRKAL